MKNNRNYYQILHVQQDAPVEVIRSSYRTIMQRLKMHPDLGGDHEEAAVVNQAYAVLTHAEKRAKYDEALLASENDESIDTSRKRKTQSNPSAPKKPAYYNREIEPSEYCSFCRAKHSLGNNIEPHSECKQCGSTLYPAIKHTFQKDDKRMIERIDKQWPVTFFTEWPDAVAYTGQTQDVSLNGLQMLTAVSLQEGQLLKMKSQTLDAVVRVMNYREDYEQGVKLWRVGMEFITLRFYKSHGTFVKLEI